MRPSGCEACCWAPHPHPPAHPAPFTHPPTHPTPTPHARSNREKEKRKRLPLAARKGQVNARLQRTKLKSSKNFKGHVKG